MEERRRRKSKLRVLYASMLRVVVCRVCLVVVVCLCVDVVLILCCVFVGSFELLQPITSLILSGHNTPAKQGPFDGWCPGFVFTRVPHSCVV